MLLDRAQDLFAADKLAVANVEELIFEFILEHRQDGALCRVLAIKNLGGSIGPGDFGCFSPDRTSNYLLNSDFTRCFQSGRRRPVKPSNIAQGNKLKTVAFSVGSPHELAARFSRGVDRRWIHR